MRADFVSRIILVLAACLLGWDVYSREVRPVQAQSTYTVVRLGNSPSDWANRLNEHGRKLVAVVPLQHNDSAGHQQNEFIVVLQ
jgi:hypothetical protein